MHIIFLGTTGLAFLRVYRLKAFTLPGVAHARIADRISLGGGEAKMAPATAADNIPRPTYPTTTQEIRNVTY